MEIPTIINRVVVAAIIIIIIINIIQKQRI